MRGIFLKLRRKRDPPVKVHKLLEGREEVKGVLFVENGKAYFIFEDNGTVNVIRGFKTKGWMAVERQEIEMDQSRVDAAILLVGYREALELFILPLTTKR